MVEQSVESLDDACAATICETTVACAIRRVFGRNLAPYVLKPAAIEGDSIDSTTMLQQITPTAVQGSKGTPPTDPPGFARVLFVDPRSSQTDEVVKLQAAWNSRMNLLAPAYFLPFQWVSDRKQHDERLPQKLQLIADEIRKQIPINYRELRLLNVALTLAIPSTTSREIEIQAEFLKRLEFESGWLPLAGALYALLTGADKTPSRVLATGAFDSEKNRLEPVGGIAQKLYLARKLNASHLFVLQDQEPKAFEIETRLVAEGIPTSSERVVRGLQFDTDRHNQTTDRNPLKCCAPYFAALQASPPTKTRNQYMSMTADQQAAHRNEQKVHFDRLAALHVPSALEFYRSDMLIPVSIETAAQVITSDQSDFAEWCYEKSPTLVTIASGNPALVVMAWQLVNPAKVLLLRTDCGDGGSFVDRAKKLLIESGCCTQDDWSGKVVVSHESKVCYDNIQGSVTDAVKKARRSTNHPFVFDITPGQKFISLLFLQELADAGKGDRLVYLRHDYSPELRAAIPGTERWWCWKPSERPPFDKDLHRSPTS